MGIDDLLDPPLYAFYEFIQFFLRYTGPYRENYNHEAQEEY